MRTITLLLFTLTLSYANADGFDHLPPSEPPQTEYPQPPQDNVVINNEIIIGAPAVIPMHGHVNPCACVCQAQWFGNGQWQIWRGGVVISWGHGVPMFNHARWTLLQNGMCPQIY